LAWGRFGKEEHTLEEKGEKERKHIIESKMIKCCVPEIVFFRIRPRH
jgi:hypothetical protein